MAETQRTASISRGLLTSLSGRLGAAPPGTGLRAGLVRRLHALLDTAFHQLREYTHALHDYLDQSYGEAARERSRLQAEIDLLRREVDELKRKVPEPVAPPKDLDRLYLDFQNRFRGNFEEIRSRLTVYLPVLDECGAGQAGRPLLDLACGRGEWLDLLRIDGLVARGVDASPAMVESCQGRGLMAELADAIEYLRAQPAGHWGAITAFHLIEHLDFFRQVEFLDLALNALKPGGVLILETPNPLNLQVATHTFHIDPTHTRPVPPLELTFLLEARGFKAVRTMPLNPYPDSCRMTLDGTAASGKLNDLLYGPQDYGVVARKE